jgi:hypothetical protein
VAGSALATSAIAQVSGPDRTEEQIRREALSRQSADIDKELGQWTNDCAQTFLRVYGFRRKDTKSKGTAPERDTGIRAR